VVEFLAEARDICVHHCVQTDFVATQLLFVVRKAQAYPGPKLTLHLLLTSRIRTRGSVRPPARIVFRHVL
jgi:hypothetical protein